MTVRSCYYLLLVLLFDLEAEQQETGLQTWLTGRETEPQTGPQATGGRETGLQVTGGLDYG